VVSLANQFADWCIQPGLAFTAVTGQFADKPTRGQSSRGLVNSRTSQLEYIIMLFQTDYTIYTLPIFDRVRVKVRVSLT